VKVQHQNKKAINFSVNVFKDDVVGGLSDSLSGLAAALFNARSRSF